MLVQDMIEHYTKNIWEPRSTVFGNVFLESAISVIKKEGEDPNFDYAKFVTNEIKYMDANWKRIHCMNLMASDLASRIKISSVPKPCQ
jgi:hypothetical protein